VNLWGVFIHSPIFLKEGQKMKHEIFVEQVNINLKEGIKVTKETELVYKNDDVEQVLKDLVLETILDEEGTNGFNTYKSKSYLSITLNEGDILLFDEKRGYYMPSYPVTSIDDAISDINSLSDIPRFKE
jgi:hypothetical protein